jgi:DNA mismatch repair protein MutS2
LEKKRLEDLILSYEQKMIQLKRDVSVIRKKAADEAKDIVQQAQRKVEHSVKEIRESGAQKEVVFSSRRVLKQLGEELHRISVEEQSPAQYEGDIQKGDIVQIREGHERGEVVDIQGKYGIIIYGTTKLRVNLKELKKVHNLGEQKTFKASEIPTINAENQIDLRGLLGEEAIGLVQKFLDNAYAAGFHRVDIIHGKGSGALRKKISEFIKLYPHVKSFRLGEWNEGGTGVTVVEFD